MSVQMASLQVWWLSCPELGLENVSLPPGFYQTEHHSPGVEWPRGLRVTENRHGFPGTDILLIIAIGLCHMGSKQPVLQRRLLGPQVHPQ